MKSAGSTLKDLQFEGGKERDTKIQYKMLSTKYQTTISTTQNDVQFKESPIQPSNWIRIIQTETTATEEKKKMVQRRFFPLFIKFFALCLSVYIFHRLNNQLNISVENNFRTDSSWEFAYISSPSLNKYTK